MRQARVEQRALRSIGGFFLAACVSVCLMSDEKGFEVMRGGRDVDR